MSIKKPEEIAELKTRAFEEYQDIYTKNYAEIAPLIRTLDRSISKLENLKSEVESVVGATNNLALAKYRMKVAEIEATE
jgi:hypothetical protein